MKKVIGLVLILLIVGVAAPFGFGFWADARLNAMLEDFNKGGMLDFTVIKTNKGWFTSSAIIEAELAGSLASKYSKASEGGAVTPPKVVLKSTIYHGPFPFMSGSFSLNPVIGLMDTQFIKDLDSEEPLINLDYTVKTEFSLAGDSNVLLDIPEWTGPLGSKDNANVEWKGLSGSIKMAKGLKNTDLNITAPLLKITSDTANLIVESLQMTSSSYIGIAGLSMGKADFSIANIEFNDPAKSVVSIGNTSIKADTSETGSNVNSEIAFNMAKLNIAGAEYGPAVFSMAFRNLEANAVARINEKMKEIQSQNIPKDQVGMMMGATLMGELSNLLKQGPEIEISELSMASAVGKMTGNARVTVDTSKPELLSNPFLVKDAIVGELDFSIPEELLVIMNMGIVKKELKDANIDYSEDQLKAMAKSRVAKNMGGLVAANIFTKVGNMYQITASFEKGIPTVNGSVLAIPFGGAPAQ